MKYVHRDIGNCDIFEIEGEFIISEIKTLLKEYTKLLKENRHNFIFDLSRVSFLDSSAIGTIIMGASNAVKHGKKIKLVLPESEFIKDTFRVIRLDKIIDYFQSQSDAINSINQVDMS